MESNEYRKWSLFIRKVAGSNLAHALACESKLAYGQLSLWQVLNYFSVWNFESADIIILRWTNLWSLSRRCRKRVSSTVVALRLCFFLYRIIQIVSRGIRVGPQSYWSIEFWEYVVVFPYCFTCVYWSCAFKKKAWSALIRDCVSYPNVRISKEKQYRSNPIRWSAIPRKYICNFFICSSLLFKTLPV